ncbi:L-threonylcarbamoyladenylate synthase [Natronospira proteinivora]|uniref:Threonylcarbamoyl-AMP synthase n=1 Tax=Natronospira proteinivora TaxID=1807133 RepID=A0ABT1G9W2_9GAMM|nr:L-threonylcarbamoyladenylate synthase [Natronospira proteinivora]MCP1728079.1 L-threonylcarbamoyladenylate synthase [Natronospira proteinivora]
MTNPSASSASPRGTDLNAAIAALRPGGLVAYPTEGVYGLGCDAFNGEAVQKLLSLKQRPFDKGLIVIGASLLQLEPLLHPLNRRDRDTLNASWPGPVTWIVPAADDCPDWLTGGRDTLAVRVPDHSLARELCQQFRGPVTSTSANPSGQPALTDADEVAAAFPSGLDYLLDGAVGGRNGPSEIRELASGKVLRGE